MKMWIKGYDYSEIAKELYEVGRKLRAEEAEKSLELKMEKIRKLRRADKKLKP